MPLRSYNYKCHDCDEVFVKTVEYHTREDEQECPICGNLQCPRTWEGFSVAVSTSKTSSSIPDAAARGRFDGIRRNQELAKAKAHARATGDRQTEKEINHEIKRRSK